MTDVTADIDFLQKHLVDNISFSYLKQSELHGVGSFASQNIAKDTTLGILDGQVMPWEKYNSLEDSLKEQFGAYKNYIFMEWNAIDEETLLVRPFRTKYSYINHSRTPNLALKYHPLRVVAIKDILKDEEFTLDYRQEKLNEKYLSGHGSTYL
jgi:SET domain-containing protein